MNTGEREREDGVRGGQGEAEQKPSNLDKDGLTVWWVYFEGKTVLMF
jgi:hypothetical protein